MDIEKLIEQLNDWNEKYISNLCGDRTIKCEEYCIKDDCLIVKAATALSTLQAENAQLRAELERVKVERDAYQVYFKDLSSKPDCNTCEKRNCDYRPRLGATVRANCPLYSGPQKED